MYVLDTNTLIYYFKGIGKVADIMLNHPPFAIGIPTVVLFELEVGLAKSISSRERRTQLEKVTSIVNVLPFGATEAQCAAAVRAELEMKGTPIGPYDILIAGTALANKSTLVTHNRKEFERVNDLRIEDWY